MSLHISNDINKKGIGRALHAYFLAEAFNP